ncbi:MAG: hypothetical protein JWP04_2930, partial [Belnapia sp.]|nr:hypothetical protein [Belnapia sp.]
MDGLTAGRGQFPYLLYAVFMGRGLWMAAAR